MIKDPLILDYNLFKNVSLALGRGVDTALNMAKKNQKSVKNLSLFLALFWVFQHEKNRKLENRISALEKVEKSGIKIVE